MEKDLNKLEKNLGIEFQNKELLEVALTHRSFINENKDINRPHNERLEFLGDAVLELITTTFLFDKYPDKNEGDLTSYRTGLVNTYTLSKVADKLSVNDFLFLSKGEAKDTGRARQFILANTMEAIIGAIYRDQGYDKAKEFITNKILVLTDNIVENRLWQDAKSRFQEMAQEKENVTPTYEVLASEGPDHQRIFTVGVFLNGEKIAEGDGEAKQEAEQMAAEKALETKGW